MAKRMLIAGGSGLIGTALKTHAEQAGYEVVLLSRSTKPASIQWDPAAHTIAIDHPIFFDAIVNLAGTSIASGRWTKKRKYDILKSRLDSTKTIETYLRNGMLTTYCYVGASAYGIYGDHGDEAVTEETTIENSGYLTDVVIQWEAAHRAIESLGIRTIITRFSIVLSMEGGALKELLQTAKLGVLAYIGNGKQFWPWIHIDDLADLVLHLIHDEKAQGVYFTTSPAPVRNRDIIFAANRQYSVRRIVMPAPSFGLNILLGEMHRPMLDSCRGSSVRIEREGFQFAFPTIDQAMQDLIRVQTPLSPPAS
jgi:uncharacterized protein (TIGR01777 family)